MSRQISNLASCFNISEGSPRYSHQVQRNMKIYSIYFPLDLQLLRNFIKKLNGVSIHKLVVVLFETSAQRKTSDCEEMLRLARSKRRTYFPQSVNITKCCQFVNIFFYLQLFPYQVSYGQLLLFY